MAGEWRDDAHGGMEVVSGPVGRETVHYAAPAPEHLPNEMSAFLEWFESEKTTDPVLDAAIAHLWFVTIHPFDDGNGRIARAISDLALARSEHSPQRFYSMSSRIREEQKEYYNVLEATQKGDLDITRWLQWFLICLEGTLNSAEETLRGVVEKARFWERIKDISINERQRKVLIRLLDDFEGKLTLSRWANITHTSKPTAGRDLEDLVRKGILVSVGAGRSTSYKLEGRSDFARRRQASRGSARMTRIRKDLSAFFGPHPQPQVVLTDLRSLPLPVLTRRRRLSPRLEPRSLPLPVLTRRHRRPPTVYLRLPPSPLPTAYRLLPSAFCLLLISRNKAPLASVSSAVDNSIQTISSETKT